MTIEPDLSRAVWQKSSYSNGQGGNCVEVATNLAGFVGVRDSKDPLGGVLVIGRETWMSFMECVRVSKP